MAKGKKTGGRQKGTPNKENPLKGYLRAHSLAYFEPRVQTDPITGGSREIQRQRLVQDEEGNVYKVIDLIPLTDHVSGLPLNISDFEADMIALSPNERVNAELRLLEFHTPKMKAVEVDMDVHGSVVTIEDRLRELCGEDEEDDD
jgi:hypothetical protein|nr:MAG TPA: hypothetical protein [Caudoviricetes sp.]